MGDNGTVSSEDKMLPEQLMLGLRLTVGEDQVPISIYIIYSYLFIQISTYLLIYLFMCVQVARPQPPSRLGRGNFPERELARAAEAEQYYPGLPSIATLGETSLHS